jgi:hypothetical protein
MNLMIIKNPDEKEYNRITKEVKNNAGYCPCSFVKDKFTKCQCKEFKDQATPGWCHCKRFLKVEVI